MPNVQIRGVPEDVHRELKVQAAQAGQSMNEFLLVRLAEVTERPTLARLAERAVPRAPGSRPTMEDIVQAIHEGRPDR